MLSTVTKRSGVSEPYQAQKVKNAIAYATQGLDVNPLELESKFDETLYDGIPTTLIHKNLVHHARSLCTAEAPDWTFVAGRLQTMMLWAETGAYKVPFEEYLDAQIESKIYRHPSLWTAYSRDDWKELGACIRQDRDLEHSYGSVLTAQKKYLLKNECIQQKHMANAMIIASVETPATRLRFAKEVYEALSLRKVSLATPWLSNLRSNGNISSCFIIQLDDDLDSIFENVWNIARISKSGGGVGVDVSRIRSAGAEIAGRPDSSGGVVGWIKIINDTAVAVDQGGKRAGAVTVHLPAWHRDIDAFLELQMENGDLRKRAFDVFPQMGCHDEFMRRVENEEVWYTFCPHEVYQKMGFRLTDVYGETFTKRYLECVDAYLAGTLKLVDVYDNARTLFKKAMMQHFENGLPYMPFLDTINERNPNKHDGSIPCVNLCVESFSNVQAGKLAHTCNLASVVVGRMQDDADVIRHARLLTRVLDNGIYLTKAPIEISAAHNERYRTIGVGIQGLHDYLAVNFLSYNSTKAIAKLSELIEYGCVIESTELARERGAYPAFEGSEWANGNQIAYFKSNSVAGVDWDAAQENINVYGIRNSQNTSPAPNTSTSIYMDAAAGAQPVYAPFFMEDNTTGKFPVVAMHLKLNPVSYARTYPMMNQEHLVDAISALQLFVDTGISAEYIFDRNKPDFTAKTLYDVLIRAWKKKTKAVYYIRQIKPGQTWNGKPEEACAGCAG